ncbi:MAG: type IV pilus assembly protein PilM, partial [Kiritimatiellae bacterium]|nr:type IV pilus assembly protein PilM [Kiritimatiellia bacterium]
MVGGAEKFEQSIRLEIEQNIPFPIDEMVCDRQLLGDTETGDKSVLIVAAKVDQVEAITAAVQSAGFDPVMVDVAPMALVNVVRAGASYDGGCAVILDIGAKTTSLAIVEGDKLYNRAIPVAGKTLTKDIAQALGCTLEEAEDYKIGNAYVSQGGVTEDDDPARDAVSKVCRTVMTRLNAEISRSINFYRSQQGGGTPTKLFITGGTALLPGVDTFFAESLGIEVELLNPFEAIVPGSAIDQEALGADMVFLAPTAGLALHQAGLASLNIDLLPPSIIEARAEVARIPFVVAGSVMFVGAAIALFLALGHSTSVVQAQVDAVGVKANVLKGFETAIKAEQANADAAGEEAEKLREIIGKRSQAIKRMDAFRHAVGPVLWIHSWDGKTLVVRGWKEKAEEFCRTVAKDGKVQTAPEVVADSLRKNPDVDPESVKVMSSTYFGKNDSLVQFSVEVSFK